MISDLLSLLVASIGNPTLVEFLVTHKHLFYTCVFKAMAVSSVRVQKNTSGEITVRVGRGML